VLVYNNSDLNYLILLDLPQCKLQHIVHPHWIRRLLQLVHAVVLLVLRLHLAVYWSASYGHLHAVDRIMMVQRKHKDTWELNALVIQIIVLKCFDYHTVDHIVVDDQALLGQAFLFSLNIIGQTCKPVVPEYLGLVCESQITLLVLGISRWVVVRIQVVNVRVLVKPSLWRVISHI
jgi:hypothetical protein